MRELELRLALVCYGGASLAVYMNGISHEILKLIRASRAYHSIDDREKRNSATFLENAPKRPYETDTESLYFELFQLLGPKIDLRVIVDVISGTSAGGINGIFLARAIAHDLDFNPLRDMWLELGDVEHLMEQGTIAERFSKFYLYPLIWLFADKAFGDAAPDEESKRKLSRFLRSRWFQPPFSGKRMLSWMINACKNMGEADTKNSLLPSGHKLDLFVSITNFFGQPRRLKLHDPKEIKERQHKVALNFSYLKAEGQDLQTELDDGNIPGLGFAARATSSFPGAFPPIRFSDLTEYMKRKGLKWPKRGQFMAKNFPNQLDDPETLNCMSFIDGGVTNNKPFGEALDAMENRAAHREVDRRIIYVDPSPDTSTEQLKERQRETPSFFKTILSSLAEIPRNEPIYDDLQEIAERNKEAHRMETVFETIDAEVRQLVDSMLQLDADKRVGTAMLSSWCERAHRLAEEKAGYGFSTYMQSKVLHVLDQLARLLVNIAKHNGLKLSQTLAQERVTAWAESLGITKPSINRTHQDLQNFIKFLRTFDVDFRVRKLRFTVSRLNQYLQNTSQETSAFHKLTKQQLYKSMETYRAAWQASTHTDTLDEIWKNKALLPDDAMPAIMARIGDTMLLEDHDFITDDFMALTLSGAGDEDLKLTLFRAYVGYAFYDVLTLPMSSHSDLQEIDEIRVDRISPVDCSNMHGDISPLKGTELYKFGAFFSRRARENDYLWGRIHAANRLIDFVLDAAGKENIPDDFDKERFKKRLANRILSSEEHVMKNSADLIANMRKMFS